MTIGERIKKIRNKLDMSQVDFANKIDVSKQTLYKYENNLITNIPSDKIESIAKLGSVSPAYLMGWEEDEINSSITNINSYLQYIKESEVLKLFQELDDIGQEMVIENMKLVKKVHPRQNNITILNAAHARTDIEVTNEDIKHDEDIMDDENF